MTEAQVTPEQIILLILFVAFYVPVGAISLCHGRPHPGSHAVYEMHKGGEP